MTTRRLMLFGTTKLSDMLEKGNVWYVRHYEEYFDDVYVIYLLGGPKRELSQGSTHLISVGRGRGWLDLALAPIRLWRTARRLGPTSYLTADIVFGWWTSLLIRLFGHARIVLLPVCLPHEIYRSSRRSISGVLPIPLERLFLRLSYAAAWRIVTGQNIERYVSWLSGYSATAKKLRVVDTIVEEFPTAGFYQALKSAPSGKPVNGATPKLLYVGRLHREKLVADLVDMMGHLREMDLQAELIIAGDGVERDALEAQARTLGVSDRIQFLGNVANADLVDHYRAATLFVSTVTGTSLREAGLADLPVVAYAADWAKALLVDGETALLAPPGDSRTLAKLVATALKDPELRARIRNGFHQLALQYWDIARLRSGLAQTFATGEEAAAGAEHT